MFRLSSRSVIKITGRDAATFLHNVTTNDVMAMASPSVIYNCILNSRGRFLYDFFLIRQDECFLIDCEGTERDDLIAFLRLYRVQLKVKVLKADQYAVAVNTSARNADNAPSCLINDSEDMVIFPDVRCQELGMRYIILVNSPSYAQISGEQNSGVYDKIRIQNTVPATEDMVKEESFPLHYGLDHLHAICHKKGCYIGQETVARMHIVGAKKHLVTLTTAASTTWPPFGTEVYADNMPAGRLLTTAGQYGLALLETNKITATATSSLRVGDVPVTLQAAQ